MSQGNRAIRRTTGVRVQQWGPTAVADHLRKTVQGPVTAHSMKGVRRRIASVASRLRLDEAERERDAEIAE